MALVAWLTVLVAGSGLVLDPPPGTPITDPSRAPLPMGLGNEPDVQEAFGSPTVLFVNFDGPLISGGCGNNSQQDCSILYPGVQFDPSPSDAAKRAAVVQATREDVLDFGVIVVGERPPEGNPYAMVVVGTPAGGAPSGVGGVAPGIDCGNNSPNMTSFSFLVNASTNTQATVIHQEAAHTWGLEHVNDITDNLYPATTGGSNDPKYNDVCSTVVGDTMLNPTGSLCNTVHTLFCPPNEQNSYQEMLLLFGPPIPDLVAPTVVIDSPSDGQALEYTEDFDLTVTLDDDRRPQILSTLVYFDDIEEADAELFDSTLTFPVNGGDAPSGHGLSNGFHTIRVDIIDESGNPASDEVTIEIVGSPFGDPNEDPEADTGTGNTGMDDSPGGTGNSDSTPMDTGLDDTGDEGCGCRRSGPPPSAVALFLLSVVLGRRRRR